MKPSERRALREQNAIGKDTEPQNVYQSTADHLQSKKTSEGSQRKEGFFQSHVRLITFLICIGVFLLVFGPWNIYRISKSIADNKKTVDGKRDMSMETVYALSERGEELSWLHFEEYNYTDMSYSTNDGEYIKREYHVKDTGYIVWVGGIKGQDRPDYIYLIDIGKTGNVMNMREGTAKEFVQKNQQAEENS